MKIDSEETIGMTSAFNEQSPVIRTERGLTIAGTRITLYDVMDYVTAQYPPRFIRAMLSLTDEQIDAALSYIQMHRVAVEAEYQTVLQEAKELQQYWEEQNRSYIIRSLQNVQSLVQRQLELNFRQQKPNLKLRDELSD